jgi:NAD+ kinase
MRIAIYSRQLKKDHRPYVLELLKALQQEGHELIIFEDYLKHAGSAFKAFNSLVEFRQAEDLLGVEAMLSIGGDGTLLDTLHLIRDSGIPVAGINMGRLGFLADIHRAEIAALVKSIGHNSMQIEERTLIQVEANKPLFGNVNYGLNDFTIHKTDSSSMITVHVFLNGEFLNSFWADGLIIATPTGSTAYSLSCGGPIMFPEASTFSIVPVAPHNLNVRPIVIPDHTVLSFEVESRSKNFLCTLDSRFQPVDKSYQIAVRKADFKFKLLHMPDSHYIRTIREKLMWGGDARN